MSRIGKTPIDLPQGVTASLSGSLLKVVGPKGNLTLKVPESLAVTITGNVITVKISGSDPILNQVYGLTRTLIQNAVTGLTRGWEKTVELVGVGYKVSGGGSEVTLLVGFTHPVKVTAPPSVTFQIKDNTKIIISGIDKMLVGEVAARRRAIKPPEPYKGKGVRYLGEIVRKKAGKAVKAVGAPA